jgi:hypothetical protein
MVAGLASVVAETSASALTFNTFYVSPKGSTNINNNCSNKAVPCATIAQAIAADVAAIGGAAPSTIQLAKGTYNETVTLTGGTKAKITIAGTVSKSGKLRSTIAGAVTLGSASDGLTGVVVNSGSATGVTVGSSAAGATVGPNVTVENSSVDGISVGNATALVNGVTVSAPTCTTTTTADMSYASGAVVGTFNPFALSVKSIPKCAKPPLNGASVTINGFPATVDSAGKHTLGVTAVSYGAGPPCSFANPTCDSPTGSVVNFTPSVIPFGSGGAGVDCASACTVENSTIAGVGVGDGIATAAGGTLSGNKISGAAIGIATATAATATTVGTGACIGFCPPLTFNTTGNTVSGSTIAIQVKHGANGTVNVAGNSASGLTWGIQTSRISASDSVKVTGNSATGSSLGVGVGLIGSDVTHGNNISGSAVNVMVANAQNAANCASPVASTNNKIQTNTISGGLLFGVATGGGVATTANPTDLSAVLGLLFGVQNCVSNSGNTIQWNKLSGSGVANIADFNSFQGTSAYPPNSFVQVCDLANCPVLGSGAVPAGTTVTQLNLFGSGTLTAGTVLEDITAGSPPGSGVPITFFVNGSCILAATGTTCTVDSLVGGHFPLNLTGVSDLDSIIVNPNQTYGGPYGADTTGTINAYAGNLDVNSTPVACNVGQNGSATFAAATDNAGYFGC